MSRSVILVRLVVCMVLLLSLVSSIGTTSIHAATFTVTKTADTNDGTCDTDCSLREAIAAANSNPGADTIEFNIPTSDPGYINPDGSRTSTGEPASTYETTIGGFFRIHITTGMPAIDITDGLTIDGYSQPGSSHNTAKIGDWLNTVLKIQIASNINTVFHTNEGVDRVNHLRISGINSYLYNFSNSEVVRLNDGNNHWLWGNFFGTDVNGVNFRGYGHVLIRVRASNSTIGTNGDGFQDTAERNIISGRSADLGHISFWNPSWEKTGWTIAGNYIGPNASGYICDPDLANTTGRSLVWLAPNIHNIRVGTNFDGVSDQEEGNIIGCLNNVPSFSSGLIVINGNKNNAVIQGNFIGVSPNGTPLYIPGALSASAVFALSTYGMQNTQTLIAKNQIFHKDAPGVVFSSLSGNFSSVTLSQNVIYGEHPMAVSFEGKVSPTPNDPHDLDTGPNDLMNYPIIDKVDYLGGDKYFIKGYLDGNKLEAPYTIEICRSSNHSSSHGGCLTSLTSFTLSGPGSFETTIQVDGVNPDSLFSFSSLATNKYGSTSEFGPNVQARRETTTPSTNNTCRAKYNPTTDNPSDCQADLKPFQGGLIETPKLKSLTLSNTFPIETYLSVDTKTKQGIYRLSPSSYYQASDIYDVWYHSSYNHARVLPSLTLQPFILIFPYDPATIEPTLPLSSLTLAYSGDDGKTWRLLPNTVHNRQDHSLSIATNTGGQYMIVGGYR